MQAVAHVLDLGTIFLSVTCEQTGINMTRILNMSMPLVMPKMSISGTQPQVFLTANVISIWENSFGTCEDRKDIEQEHYHHGDPDQDLSYGKGACLTGMEPV